MRQRIAKYEVLEKIAEGGYGVVYKARDPFIKRLVAIKTCSVENEGVRERFVREAQIAGRFDHLNVTIVHDFGIEEGMAYLVQEYLSGEDLTAKIRRREPLPLPRKVEILVGVARGLAYAHRQGVIHRDVKPGNIRVLETGQVKIMDFGVARATTVTGPRLTQHGMALGTMGYLSPEQLRDEEPDQRTDIFSFGIVAYELLTYRRPFQGAELVEVMRAVQEHDPPPIGQFLAGCPPRLEALVVRCLAKDRQLRWASCEEVVAELEAVARELVAAPVAPTMLVAPSEAIGEEEPSTRPFALPGAGAADGDRFGRTWIAPSLPPSEIVPPAPPVATAPIVVPPAGPTAAPRAAAPPPAEAPAATTILPASGLSGSADTIRDLVAAGDLERAREELENTLDRHGRQRGEPSLPPAAPAPPPRLEPLAAPAAPVAAAMPVWRRPLVLAAVAALVLLAVAVAGWLAFGGEGDEAADAGPSVAQEPAAPPPLPVPAADEKVAVSVIAVPWGEIVSVLDAEGRPVEGAGAGETPALLHLAPGVYSIVVSHPAAPEPGVCQVEVTPWEPPVCRVELLPVDVQGYFRETGWWR